jgi:hypothetical protein
MVQIKKEDYAWNIYRRQSMMDQGCNYNYYDKTKIKTNNKDEQRITENLFQD